MGDRAGSLLQWDVAVLQLSSITSAALLSATGLTRIKRGFWRVLNHFISSEILEGRGRGFSPKRSCFLVSFD